MCADVNIGWFRTNNTTLSLIQKSRSNTSIVALWAVRLFLEDVSDFYLRYRSSMV